MSRACRQCSACCTTHAVPEIGKAEGARCPSVRPGWRPCAVYETRPQACRDFACLWLTTAGAPFADSDRPDLLGVVFDADQHPRYGLVFRLFEVRAGAADGPRVQVLARGMARAGLVIVFAHGGAGRRVIGGPAEAVARFRQDLALAVVP